MARIVARTDRITTPLTDGWECALTQSGSIPSPGKLDSLDWLPAPVPGTVAGALRSAGRWDATAPLGLDDCDIWYRLQLDGPGETTLHFAGLATIADVWLNGQFMFRSDNMFLSHAATVECHTTNELHICFRSLTAWLATRQGRARWRTQLSVPTSLRFVRTTLLGRMPGWCPSIHPVGPWRPIVRTNRSGTLSVRSADLSASVLNDDGQLALSVEIDGNPPPDTSARVEVGAYSTPLRRSGPSQFTAIITIPGVAKWWPHTHGEPHLYPVKLFVAEIACDLGQVGFREIVIDRGQDGRGFKVRVNGQDIFCRGACWTTPDIVTLPCTAASYRPWLEAARDAGINMIRISGTMVYEADDFYALCDALGVLVWQDVMLANFDYPATDEFRTSLAAEVAQFLDRTQGNACLAVLCGGSEVLQQASMLGLTSDRIDDTLYAHVIPRIAERIRPELAYVVNSPSGGEPPFKLDTGVAHYYGVGAYMRPLDDLRRSRVRFASECLALANVPCRRSVDELAISDLEAQTWKQGIPRDRGAAWDFEDVRDHYLHALFAVDPRKLRAAEPERYLELSRAVSCVLIEAALAEWRRVGSHCWGALVWQFQDVIPGAGWGLIDAMGRRKPAWHALRRASQSRQLVITDEGLNGLDLHIINETNRPLQGLLRLSCMRQGGIRVRDCERLISVNPHSAKLLNSRELLPAFFDITYAYRFGPPAHNVSIATLHDATTDTRIAEAFHFPAIGLLPVGALGIEVEVEKTAGRWWLNVHSRDFAQFLHIDDAAYSAEDDWFHLSPGNARRVELKPDQDTAAVPNGVVRALNLDRAVAYAGEV